MATIKTIRQSFGGGEVTQELYGRIDDAKYQAGVATMRNFIATPHGPAHNRPGFQFVREVQDSARKTRIIPFVYSTTQSFCIELGHRTIRFHTDGATLMTGLHSAYDNARAYQHGETCSSGGVNYYCLHDTTGHAPPDAYYWYAQPASGEYEIPSPYDDTYLMDIHYVQSADVITLVHPSYAPKELRRMEISSVMVWVLSTISFSPDISAPTGVAVAATVGTGSTTYKYKVATVGDDGLNESLASSPVTCTNNLLTTGNYNTITWTAASGAKRYNVYKESNGLYGYIGQTDGVQFVDDNITADVSKTPPESYAPFVDGLTYPGAVSYFEQRRVFGGAIGFPQTIWMTRTGTESNLSYSLPTRDDDGITFKIASRENNMINHLVPLSDLAVLSTSAEWRVTSVNSDAITPSSISVRAQSYIGANSVQPIIVNKNLIYAAARGGHIREMAYNWQAGGYLTGDLSLRATHLFDNLTIADMAYVKCPQPICWFVSSNGSLLGLTYVPEQQVGAWHHHDTAGVFESVCAVPEGNEDRLYAVIKRTINGSEVRYIERMASRQFVAQKDAFFVDCGLTYNGSPATTISGLDHLEGCTVNVLADGAVVPQCVVSGGAITIAQSSSTVQVGLPITADLQTLPVAAALDGGYGQGRMKNVNKVWLRVYRSGGIFVGPDENNLRGAKIRTTEAYGSPPSLVSELVQVMMPPSWSDDGQVFVRQTEPLPLTVTALIMEVAVG